MYWQWTIAGGNVKNKYINYKSIDHNTENYKKEQQNSLSNTYYPYMKAKYCTVNIARESPILQPPPSPNKKKEEEEKIAINLYVAINTQIRLSIEVFSTP
jgi:hypothetical protein